MTLAVKKRESPVRLLGRFGQSPWLDYIDRELLRSGEFQRMTERWGLTGLTSNPAIFEKVVSKTAHYDRQIDSLVAAGMDGAEIYEAIVFQDIRDAADMLRPLYIKTDRRDGFVSLEVSPHLVNDSAGTIAEARRYWQLLDRPNIMIKVPGTSKALPAIRQLLAEGVNVNVTLLFSPERYREIASVYLAGLEAADAAGRELASIASVASFFLSRIDSRIDARLEKIAAENSAHEDDALQLRGELALASARYAYSLFGESLRSDRFRRLAARGARPQRLLWASTGTKNAAYSSVKYVEPLIGPETVNTMPLATLQAYDTCGDPAQRLDLSAKADLRIFEAVQRVGIDMEAEAEALLKEGIRKFTASFDALQKQLNQRCA